MYDIVISCSLIDSSNCCWRYMRRLNV